MPVIAIEGMVFHAPVGVYPSEKLLGNDLEVSVKIALQESVTAHEDDLAYTVDYEAIYALVRKIIAEPVNLLETAVSRIITAIFLEYPAVSKIKVRVAKLRPPLNGTVKKVWVEETQSRNLKKQM
jgi:dihydroneopterin aldolase